MCEIGPRELNKTSTSILDLGIFMGDHLSFNLHIDTILKQAFRNLGFIHRITKPFKQVTTFKILDYSFVRSILDFGSMVCYPLYKCHIDRIKRVQRKFIKIPNFRSNSQLSRTNAQEI